MSENTSTEQTTKSAWAVVFVDTGETADGHPDVLSVHATYEEALENLQADMRHVQSQHEGDCVADFDGFELKDADGGERWMCTYSIVEIEIP